MSRFAAGCAALLWAALAGSAAAQDRPDLSGYWVLKVDTPPPADSAAPGRAEGDSTAPDSTVADTTPAPPPSDLRPIVRRRGRPQEQQQLSRLVGMAAPVAAFRITQTDTAITFLNDGGFTYTVRPNGDWDSIQDGDTSIRVRARWRRRALEIEYRPPGGGRVIETYLLADSEAYLRLEVVVEHDLLAQRLWRSRMYRLEEAP